MYKIIIPSYKRSPTSPEPMRILATNIFELKPTFLLNPNDPYIDGYKGFDCIYQKGRGIQNARNAILDQLDEPVIMCDDDFFQFYNMERPSQKKKKCTAIEFFEEFNEVIDKYKNDKTAIIGSGSFIWFNFMKKFVYKDISFEDGLHWVNIPLLKKTGLRYDESRIYENVDMSLQCWQAGLEVKRYHLITAQRLFDDDNPKSPKPSAYEGTSRIEFMNNTIAKWPFLRHTDNYVRTNTSTIKKWLREHPRTNLYEQSDTNVH
jgi:hypothetical protein